MKARCRYVLWAGWAVVLSLGRCAAAQEQAPLPQPAMTGARSADATAKAGGPAGTAPADRTKPLRLNFKHVSLDQVLDYLSDAAGLVIHKEADIRAAVDVSSPNPLSCEEALQLLNAALKKSGGALLLEGRILNVMSLESVKTADLEVVSGGDPNAVEKSDQVATQIIPVRYASAGQLVNNLQMLLPATATLSVNESANALILVATKTQIRRMLRIVSAIDTSMARVAVLKVLPLRYADAKQLASVIQQLFSSQGSSQNNSGGGPFGFPGGFGPPGFGGPPGASGASESTTAGTSAAKVTAQADEQSNTLILSASPDHMAVLVQMVKEIDQPVADVTEIRLFNLHNADPTELADQLAQLFPDGSNRNSDQAQATVQFGGPPGGGGGPGGFGGPPGGPFGGGAQTDESTTSTRAKKKSAVIAVPDPRTSSLVVTAASALMPQIAKMIETLDASSARREIVQVYDLHNADPQDVSSILQDLFNRNSSTRNNNNSDRTSLLGQGNPLTTRETQQQTGSTSGTSGSGSTGGRTTGGAAAGGF